MRILITGGAGFIGAALANRLIQEGHHVRVVDDLSAGDPARLARQVLFTRGDVRDVPKLWSLLQGVQTVYHLAARVSVPESILYPREYNDVNVGGTVSLMEAMRAVGVNRVVLASSGTVYGTQPTQPVSETARANPVAPYAVSKVAAEHYLFALGALWGIEAVALRIFNAYGPEQPLPVSHAPVIPYMLNQILAHGSVVVFGNGAQTRDFVYVDDVVDALVKAGTLPNVDRSCINIGSGVEVSIRQLLRAIEKATGQEAAAIYNGEQSGGVSRLVGDIRLAQNLLHWRPRTTLEQGLTAMLAQDSRFAREKIKE